jgi:signal transduction histidine kinase
VAEAFDFHTVSELLGLLAHDLRNPLSALHSNLGYIASAISHDQSEVHEAIDDTLISCDGLAAIIDNLEVLGRGLDQKATTKGPCPIVPIVVDVIGRCRSMAQSHGVRVDLDGDLSPALRVVTNTEMVGFALGNLVRNAIQHAQGGSPVRVRIEADPKRCRIVVQDDGTPIPSELREVVFTPTGQLHCKGEARGRYGRGLGLLCARIAAEGAGASIDVEGGPEARGSCFVLSMPIG